jgi:hypothetical protein
MTGVARADRLGSTQSTFVGDEVADGAAFLGS